MNRLSTRVGAQLSVFAVAVLMAGSAVALTKDEYRASKTRISAEYKAAKA